MGRAGEGDRWRTRVPGDHGVAPWALSSALSSDAGAVAPAVLGLDRCHSERDQCSSGPLALGIILGGYLSGRRPRPLRYLPPTTTSTFTRGLRDFRTECQVRDRQLEPEIPRQKWNGQIQIGKLCLCNGCSIKRLLPRQGPGQRGRSICNTRTFLCYRNV